MHPGFIITSNTRSAGCAARVIYNLALPRQDVAHWLLAMLLAGGLTCV